MICLLWGVNASNALMGFILLRDLMGYQLAKKKSLV